jgi:hypothetical protein
VRGVCEKPLYALSAWAKMSSKQATQPNQVSTHLLKRKRGAINVLGNPSNSATFEIQHSYPTMIIFIIPDHFTDKYCDERQTPVLQV